MRLDYTLLLILLFLAARLNAQPELRIGLHLSAPWSFYNADAQLDGIEYQLVSRIFQRAGYQPKYELHSYSRLLKQFADKKLDCASPVAVNIDGASYTAPYLPFKDVALSLADKQLALTSLTQLATKRIVAYQQARQILGPEFNQVIAQASYVEMAERERQLELLFNDRVDVVIGEQRVLLYLAAQLSPLQQLTVHELFAEQAYPAACWQPELTAIFNAGMQQMRQSGELQQILAQYPLLPH